MRDLGETYSGYRVGRLLRCEGLKAQRGYGKRPRVGGAAPTVVASNLLRQQFSVITSNKVCVSPVEFERSNSVRLATVEETLVELSTA